MQPEDSPELSPVDRLIAARWPGIGFPAAQTFCGSSYEADDRATLSASENHKVAERKRRQRINGHLDNLRSLLLCNSKTDKASLLAKVVDRVRELKQQTSEIMKSDQTLIPSEADEIMVCQNHDPLEHEEHDNKSLVKAYICCDDRPDLIPDLIAILKPLPLSLLRAEMATLGGRIKNVIVLVGENKDRTDESVELLRDSLRRLVLRSSRVAGERSKRRRMFDQMLTESYE